MNNNNKNRRLKLFFEIKNKNSLGTIKNSPEQQLILISYNKIDVDVLRSDYTVKNSAI